MALIVEDGTLVLSANSYRDLDDIKAYAEARGVDLGMDDDAIEVWSNKAIAFLESKRKEYQGTKVISTQSLQFPRVDLTIDDFDFPSTEIPSLIADAQCQLIVEQCLGVDIMPTQKEPAIKSEKIGPIQTDYAVNPGNFFTPFIASVETLLEPLFKSNTSEFGIRFLRV